MSVAPYVLTGFELDAMHMNNLNDRIRLSRYRYAPTQQKRVILLLRFAAMHLLWMQCAWRDSITARWDRPQQPSQRTRDGPTVFLPEQDLEDVVQCYLYVREGRRMTWTSWVDIWKKTIGRRSNFLDLQ